MTWGERLQPAPMSRIAVVAPQDHLRDALVALAIRGTVELETADERGDDRAAEALRHVEQLVRSSAVAAISSEALDIKRLEGERRADLLAGEVELGHRAAAAVTTDRTAISVGWAATDDLPTIAAALQPLGVDVVELPRPRWAEPPTLLRPAHLARAFRLLVDTYGTVRYADIDPTVFAGITFVVMFGMMFGDVGHGFLLAAGGLWLRSTSRPALAAARRVWAIPFAAGLAAAGFGVLYGEAFGPTGLPALWLKPLESPGRLLLAGGAIGGLLLACSQALGTVNRWREHGAVAAVLAPSGVAGLLMLVALAGGAVAWGMNSAVLVWFSVTMAATGVVLLAVGAFRTATAGAGRAAEAAVELFDALLRVATNAVSFTRLAAFGLMHAAVGEVVWKATVGLFGGLVGTVAAAAMFVVGNAVAFGLEALVAGVQALRLEYYELFSRVFAGEGRPFRPWHLPLVPAKE